MQCISCGMRFGGLSGFEAHRVGDHAVSSGDNRRRCRTPEEMEAIGYVEKNGIYKKPMNEAQLARVKAIKA